MINQTKAREIQDTLNALRTKEDTVEIRILNTKYRTIAGYFNDYAKASEAIEGYIDKYNIYFTLNPVKKDLLARCKNRLKTYARETAKDEDIERIRYILIDLDPRRPSGISSTDEEKQAAFTLMEKICNCLQEEGFPEPIVADSGNGYHLLLPVDLENTNENVNNIKDFLAALDFLYSTDQVEVDRSTYNPSRIVKLYGTLACKGDNTEERPHRYSKLIKVPDNMQDVSIELIQKISSRNPQDEKAANVQTTSSGEKFDVEEFIKKYDLDLHYKARYQNKADKYILKTCPWNSDHTNSSAYIIQFDNGGIAAGCHHNSCRDESWHTLRQLLEPERTDSIQNRENQRMNQASQMIELASDCKFFLNQAQDAFAAVQIEKHWETMKVNSKRFRLYLTSLYYTETGKAPKADSLRQTLNVLEMKAFISENYRELKTRISKYKESYYYDLCDSRWRAVKIDKNGCKIEENPPILFVRNKNMKAQVEPDFTAEPKQLVELIRKHFRFKKELDVILFTIYLASCFLPQIAHPILVLFGEKGAAKSTTMRMIKRIVDPAYHDLLTMPTSQDDLAIILSNNYMPCFDNLDTLSPLRSDMLCMASTGGAFSKRKLYTDDEETILRFKRCVALNGINIVANKPDLLDRSIILELERIPKTQRKTEKAIWKDLDHDIPKFLGAIFNTLSQAISVYEEVKLNELGRMADFTCWGYAFAEVLGFGGYNFQKAYLGNQSTANEEALASHPVSAAVMAMMKNKEEWVGSVSDLLKKLESIAEIERINTRVKVWPSDANVLSRRLKEVKSNLEEIGIYYDIRHAGDYKKVTIENRRNV